MPKTAFGSLNVLSPFVFCLTTLICSPHGKILENHRIIIKACCHCWVISRVTYGQNLRGIILLHFGLVTFRFHHGRDRKPLMFMICGFSAVSMFPKTMTMIAFLVFPKWNRKVTSPKWSRIILRSFWAINNLINIYNWHGPPTPLNPKSAFVPGFPGSSIGNRLF